MTFKEYPQLPNKEWWKITDRGYWDAGATYAHLITERDQLREQLARRDAEIAELKNLLVLIFESTHPYRDDGTCTFSDSVADKWKELMP